MNKKAFIFRWKKCFQDKKSCTASKANKKAFRNCLKILKVNKKDKLCKAKKMSWEKILTKNLKEQALFRLLNQNKKTESKTMLSFQKLTKALAKTKII
jgi:hypothetical protein